MKPILTLPNFDTFIYVTKKKVHRVVGTEWKVCFLISDHSSPGDRMLALSAIGLFIDIHPACFFG